MGRNAVFALLAVGLSSCQSAGVVKDVHMGSEIAYGPEVFASYMGFQSLKAQPFYSTKSGYGFTTLNVSPFRSALSEAWSYGKQFEFTKGTTTKSICFVQPCIPMSQETGIVAMDEADFLNAARNGFTFELVGKSTKVVGKIPATAFQKALEEKTTLTPRASVAASAANTVAQEPSPPSVEAGETAMGDDG